MGSNFTAQFVVKGFRQNRTDAILNPRLTEAKSETPRKNRKSFNARNRAMGLPDNYNGHRSFWNSK